MKPLLITGLLLILSIFGTAQTKTDGKLDHLIAETIAGYNIPSMAVAVIKPDTVYYGIQGNIRIDTMHKVQLSDKYHIGSCTKAFTSFLAFQAIEENKIGLETKFVDLYPEFTSIRREYKEITLSHLLSHNAHIRPYTNGKEYKKLPYFSGSVVEKRYEFTKFILQQKPVRNGVYSNGGYVLAAMMLEKAYELPFESILNNAMDKMGLEVFYGFPNKEDISYPWGHLSEKRNQIPLAPNHEYKLEDYLLPAGDLSINILDYSVFIQAHLNGILGNKSVLKTETFEKMLYGLDSYSYGWGNRINDKEKLAFHDGSAGTFYCHSVISSTDKVALIIMINSATSKQVKKLHALSSHLLGLYKS